MSPVIEITHGDLLRQQVDAIVNPWNRNIIPWWLLLPQGVSGAIKRAAGFGPFRQLSRAGAIPLGGAVLTGAGRLPFRAIIHVAGLTIFWRSSEMIVRKCVSSALAVAAAHQIDTIAFPLIGAGTGGLDPDRVEKLIAEQASQTDYGGKIVIVRFRGAG